MLPLHQAGKWKVVGEEEHLSSSSKDTAPDSAPSHHSGVLAREAKSEVPSQLATASASL